MQNYENFTKSYKGPSKDVGHFGARFYPNTPQLVYWLRTNLSEDAFARLRGSLGSLKAGMKPTKSFPLYGRSDVSVAEDFLATISKDPWYHEWMLDYEKSRLGKWGPQGGVPNWEAVKEDFLLYYTEPSPGTVTFNKTVGKYRLLQGRPLSGLGETVDSLKEDDKIKTTASGWPTFGLKKTNPIAISTAIEVAENGEYEDSYGYVFTRFNKQKKRIFFPMPYCLMMLEAQYAIPFLKAIKNDLNKHGSKSPFMFWSDKLGWYRMYDLVNEQLRSYDHRHFVYVQIDAKKMDTTTSRDKDDSMIAKWTYALNLSPDEKQRAEHILDVEGNLPIITPDGMFTGFRGKPSGAETTNMSETCYNEDVQYKIVELFRKLYYANSHAYCVSYYGNGDDGMQIWYLPDPKDFDIFQRDIMNAAKIAFKMAHLNISDSKWHISRDYGLYCQRMIWSENNRIHHAYPAVLILNSICNPEDYYSGPDNGDKSYYDLDICQKLDNGYGLPYWHELVDYVDDGLKFKLLSTLEYNTERIQRQWALYQAHRLFSNKGGHWNSVYDDTDNIFDFSISPTISYILRKRNSK